MILESVEWFQKHGLAQYLLQKLKDLHCFEGRELDSLKISLNIISFKIMDHIKKMIFWRSLQVKVVGTWLCN